MIKRLLYTLLIFLTHFDCWAVPADPTPRKIQQPDGTFVTLSMHGDEYLNYVTTADGFTVVKDECGIWVYASKQADGTLAATDMVAHDEADRSAEEKAFLNIRPKGLAPKIDSHRAEMLQGNRVRQAQALQQRRAANYDYSKFRGLVILVEFNDRSFNYGDEMNSIMNDIVNKENYKGDSRTNYVNESQQIDARYHGSVFDYFRDNSNGKFMPKFDIVGPVKVNRSQYFAERTKYGCVLANEAADVADPLVDFSLYDGDGNGVVDLVFFVFAGYGSNVVGNDERLIWPNRSWFGSNVVKDGVELVDYACCTEMEINKEYPMLCGIGVFCHEFTHVLGLPDFYDTDYEGSGGFSAHPGGWSLMASGQSLCFSRNPCNFSLYERYLLGFCEKPTVLNEVGTYSMQEVTTNDGFWLESPVQDEFFIIENRQNTGWDSHLPGHGMMVYRVDRSDGSAWVNNCINTDPGHMYYQPLFAGGSQGGISSYDPFPGEGNVTVITNNTLPANLRTWAGEECEFALTHIMEKDGTVTFNVVDAHTFAEIVMPQQLDIYEGICYHLEPTIYMPKETYQMRWISDTPSVARVDQDGNVMAMAEGEAHVTLSVDDSISATCTVSVQPASVVPDVGTLNTVANNTPQVLQLNHAQVFFTPTKNGQRGVLVRDATGNIDLSYILHDVEPGDLLDGRIYANFIEDAKWIIMTPIEGINYAGSIKVTQGPTPEPDKVTLDNLDSCKIMDYIKIEGVTLDYRINKKGQEQLCIVNGEHIIFLSSAYLSSMDMPTKEELAVNLYDVETIISYYNIPGFDDSFALTAPVTVSQSTRIDTPSSKSQPLKGGIYNLQGQRINAPQRGLNIIEGKKVMSTKKGESQ